MPGGLLFLAVAVLVYSGWLTLALPALSFLYYCALIGGMLLAWRFHSSRIFFACWYCFWPRIRLLCLEEGMFRRELPGWTAVQAVAVLVPLDFVLIALMQERGFTVPATAPVGLMLFVQFVIVAVLCRAAEALASVRALVRVTWRHQPVYQSLYRRYALLVFAAAAFFLLMRFLFTRKPIDSALLWSLSAFFLSLRLPWPVRTLDHICGDRGMYSRRIDHRELLPSGLSR